MPDFRPSTLLFQKLKENYEIEGVSDSPRNGQIGTRRIDWLGSPDQATMDAAYEIADNHNRLVIEPSTATIKPSPEFVEVTAQDLTVLNYNIYQYDYLGNRYIKLMYGTVDDGKIEFEAYESGQYIIEIVDGMRTGYSVIEVT